VRAFAHTVCVWQDLRASSADPGEAVIIDARVDKGLGVVCDVVIRWGSISTGDYIVSGEHYGKVKLIKPTSGKTNKMLKTAGPSYPARLVGMKSVPAAGETLKVVKSELAAKQFADAKSRQLLQAASDANEGRSKIRTLDIELSGGAARVKTRIQQQNAAHAQGLAYGKRGGNRARQDFHLTAPDAALLAPRAPIILKADCDGVLSAVRDSLLGLQVESSVPIEIDIVSSGVGAVTIADVNMAAEAGGLVFAFGVKANGRDVVTLCDEKAVDIRSHNIIYSLIDDAKVELGRFLPQIEEEQIIGSLKVLQVRPRADTDGIRRWPRRAVSEHTALMSCLTTFASERNRRLMSLASPRPPPLVHTSTSFICAPV